MARKPRKKPGPVAGGKSQLVAALPLACQDEKAAVEFMERQRWGESPACPRCGDMDVYQIKHRQTGERTKRFLWDCRGCRRQFTVRIGTVFEDSRIPLKFWCYAFWKACSSKKGVSALQIQRETGLSYKSALFLMHRIRWAMTPTNDGGPLEGTVEVDETYMGGRVRHRNRKAGEPFVKGSHRAMGGNKVPVVAMVERGGRVRARVVPDVSARNLRQMIREHVSPSARLMIDESSLYSSLGKDFEGGHETVKHSIGEYGRGDAYTNTVEGFFSLLKRGVYGVFHNVSKRHLHRYVSEFEFRYNTRKLEDGERTRLAIQGADGKRLTYREPVSA
jgi:transposase-like protein